MHFNLILPKTLPDLDHSFYRDLPLFFLAGPIIGGDDWHLRMMQLLAERLSDFIIVNPSRYQPSHPLYKYRMPGKEDHFERQTDWERYFLEVAAVRWSRGCIIFWLASESKENPRKDGLPYAMDTRGEIGEWRGRLMYSSNLRVVMGADPDFPGLSQIERNFDLALGNTFERFKVYKTMEEVLEKAVRC